MASAQEPGTLRFYRINPTGTKILLFSADVALLGPSGSADGAIASTPEKWQYLPVQLAKQKILQVNDQLHVTFESRAADGIDVSDTEWAIAGTYRDGTVFVIPSPDDATFWDVKTAADVTLVASDETPICTHTVRRSFALGSNVVKSFASMEDDTA